MTNGSSYMAAISCILFVSQTSLNIEKNPKIGIGSNETKVFFFICTCNGLTDLATLLRHERHTVTIYRQSNSRGSPVRRQTDCSLDVTPFVCRLSIGAPFGYGRGSNGCGTQSQKVTLPIWPSSWTSTSIFRHFYGFCDSDKSVSGSSGEICRCWPHHLCPMMNCLMPNPYVLAALQTFSLRDLRLYSLWATSAVFQSSW